MRYVYALLLDFSRAVSEEITGSYPLTKGHLFAFCVTAHMWCAAYLCMIAFWIVNLMLICCLTLCDVYFWPPKWEIVIYAGEDGPVCFGDCRVQPCLFRKVFWPEVSIAATRMQKPQNASNHLVLPRYELDAEVSCSDGDCGAQETGLGCPTCLSDWRYGIMAKFRSTISQCKFLLVVSVLNTSR